MQHTTNILTTIPSETRRRRRFRFPVTHTHTPTQLPLLVQRGAHIHFLQFLCRLHAAVTETPRTLKDDSATNKTRDLTSLPSSSATCAATTVSGHYFSNWTIWRQLFRKLQSRVKFVSTTAIDKSEKKWFRFLIMKSHLQNSNSFTDVEFWFCHCKTADSITQPKHLHSYLGGATHDAGKSVSQQ